jgi:hypothetical protein
MLPLSSLTQQGKRKKENVDVSTSKKLIPYSSSARRKEYSSSARRKEKEDVCTYNFCKEEPESGAHSVLELLIRADVYVFLTTMALWVKELNGIPLYSRIWIHRIKPTESDLEIEFFIWPPPP